jgi:hypothetical protein
MALANSRRLGDWLGWVVDILFDFVGLQVGANPERAGVRKGAHFGGFVAHQQ